MHPKYFQLVSIVNITAIYIALALFVLFCWYQWRMIRAYGRFISKRLDVRWFQLIITGRILHNNDRLTNLIFNDLMELANTFRKEGICTVWFFKPYIIVYNEEFMKYLVNDVNLVDKASLYHVNNLIFGNGLLTSNHEVWKVHRKLLNPAFNHSALKSRISGLNKSAFKLVENIETLVDKPVDDISHFIKICTIRNMAGHVLGLNMENEEQYMWTKDVFSEVDSLAEQFVERIARPWLYWNFLLPFFKSGRKFLKSVARGDSHVRRVTDELSKNQKNGETDSENSCGHIIMKLHQDSFLTKQDVRDHMVTFTSAGYETVSVSMLWCLYTLGHHPQVQENAYNEIRSVAPDGEITYEDLTSLTYLDCVIKETLRLYTTIPIVGRKASKDIQCGKYTIPKGAEVVFFIFMLHRDPNIFPDPEKFHPERFSDSSELRPWMYMPFAEGYRNCIGKKYAMMEMKILLAYVLRRFRVTSLNKIDDSELEWTVTLKPAKSLRFLFEDRHDKNYVQQLRRENYVTSR